MILYGTETPAQPDDNPHVNQPSQFQLYGDEMAHNDIEHDASGQWRNMQQVSSIINNEYRTFIYIPQVTSCLFKDN